MAEEKKIQFFSKETNRLYQLYPTKTIPTLRISGVPMHRHIHVDPLTDTKSKINALKPCGVVLDTCTGLGYTAIYAAKIKEVKKVITVEKDFNVIEIANLNEASKELFDNEKIDLINDDVFEKIKSFDNNFFDCVLHDPPTFVLAPELYSAGFYKEIYRALKQRGRLWHYCPEPGKLSGKNKLKERIMRNLSLIGFKNIIYDKDSSGITAVKR